MTHKEALRLALEALELCTNQGMIPMYLNKNKEAITAIKFALANEALERKAENAIELGLDYEPLEAKDEPVSSCGYCPVCGAKGAIRERHPYGNTTCVNGHKYKSRDTLSALPQQEAKDEPWEKFCDSNCVWTDHHPDCKLAQPSVSVEQEPLAYGMWDTMLGYGGRMMMVRLDKGQDGCTVPLYTAPAHQNVNVDDIGVPVGVGGWLTTTSSHPDQYAKGYADAMNWKVQNHLEHLPAAQNLSEWKLVPIEPTEEMLKAMDECSTEGYDERLLAGHAASVYMAAVDVAPTPPQRKPLSYEDLIECEQLAGIRHRIHMGSIRGQQLSPADEFLWHYARAIEAAHNIKE